MKLEMFKRDYIEGSVPTKGYGVAYYDPLRKVTVLYPLGINWVVMAWREATFLYWRIAWYRPKAQLRFESKLRRLANLGYSKGFRDGENYHSGDYDRGFRDGAFMKQALEEAVPK